MATQRELNRQALEMAAAMVETADWEHLFPGHDEADEEKLHKAHANAIKKIWQLAAGRKK